MKESVLLEKENSIARIVFNRPERHNSLIPEFLEEFLEKLINIQRDSQTQVVTLTAAGKSFSTGGDIRGFYEHREHLQEYASEIVGLLNQVILTMMNIHVPIITGVQGIVTGGSLGIVLGSDIAFVTSGVTFTPFYSVVGFSPDGGWTAILPGLIGQKRVAEILILNRSITAEESVLWGIASRVVPDDQLFDAIDDTATKMLKKKSGSLRSTKRLLNEIGQDVDALLERERESFVEQIKTPEAINGIKSFLGIM